MGDTADKTYEKTLKKAKKFFDESQAVKVRAASLEEFIDNASDWETTRLLGEHGSTIIAVIRPHFDHQCDKLREKSKPGKHLQVPSKDTDQLFFSITVLDKTIASNSNQIRKGWQKDNILGIISRLLALANGSVIRSAGFQTLLHFLSIYGQPDEQALKLYKDAVPLFCFKSIQPPPGTEIVQFIGEDEKGGLVLKLKAIQFNDSATLERDKKKAHQISVTSWADACLDKNYIVLSTQPPDINDGLQLIQDLLNNLESLGKTIKKQNIEALEAFQFMWGLFKTFYLSALMPAVRKLVGDSVQSSMFELCPAPILHLLTEFLSRIAISNDLQGNNSSVFFDCRNYFMLSEEDREIVHEVARQALLLPYSENQTIRGGIHIIRSLLFSKNQSLMTHLASDNVKLNQYCRRYIRYLTIPFFDVSNREDHCADEFVCFFLVTLIVMALIFVFKRDIFFDCYHVYRWLLLSPSFDITLETQQDIILSLLFLDSKISYTESPDKYSLILEDLWETIFLGLAYIPPKEGIVWIRANQQLLVSKNSKIYVRKWTVIAQ